ncbi:MAG: hypothetical protein P1P67_09535 [Treponema phagedenis]|uniref:hypothetical protein n=2 Tax=Treponema phagedenis TaxID=162 RepID=UPI003133DE95
MTLRSKIVISTILISVLSVAIALAITIVFVQKKMTKQFYESVSGILTNSSIDLQSDLSVGYSRAESWANNDLLIRWLLNGEKEGEEKDELFKRLVEFGTEDNTILAWISSTLTNNYIFTDKNRKVEVSHLLKSEPKDSWFFKSL